LGATVLSWDLGLWIKRIIFVFMTQQKLKLS